jgi:N-acetylglucosamine kinase-like BadF-type ATPase
MKARDIDRGQGASAGLRARDRENHFDLLKELMKALDVSSAEDLVIRINEDPVRDYASLFPVVLARADAGDKQAIEVLESAGCELASLAETLIHRLFGAGEEVAIATHGGVFASSNQVKRSCEQEISCGDASF